jgi:hypothetical protein
VSRVVKRISCQSTILRQEELAFIKVISTLQLFPALLKKLRMALSRKKKKKKKKKKKPVVPLGSRSTTPGGGSMSSQRPFRHLAGKRKANKLANSGDSPEPAKRHIASGAGSAPLPATSSEVTGEITAVGSRQLGHPDIGLMYAAELAGLVALFWQVCRSRPQS